jgi:hypothetical protein
MQAVGIGGKPDGGAQNLIIEQPPAPASADVKNADAQAAADQRRKRSAAAGGRSGTVKTGPQGLGEVSADNQQTKTLLGY